MSVKPGEELKTVAKSLAEMLASGKADHNAVLSMLKELGYASLHENSQEKAGQPAIMKNIGIYSPEVTGEKIHYRRNIAFKDKWNRFADIESIPPKGAQKRIVLLGESVARGFLLDPGYTPASLLETLLNSNTSGDEFEVIDLAETNLSMEGIRLRYTECLALQPDLVIFFAGNNWRTDLEVNLANDPANLYKLINEIKKHGRIAGIKEVIEKSFASLINSLLRHVHESATKNNIKIIFTIPEFNLLDYRSTPGERFVSKLPGDGTSKWVTAMNKAQAALTTGNMEQAAMEAAMMIDIDPTHPLGYEIIADYEISRGNYAAARTHLESARDTALFFRTNSKPRMFRIIRETILAKAIEYGINVVDIAVIFRDHLKGKLPGRSLFFDYCHLTAEGIQVAIDAVAKSTVHILCGGHVSIQRNASSIQPDRHINAMGHFLAAIHNGHWGQSYEILYYHCRHSLQNVKEMGKCMLWYIDMANRTTSNILCQSFAKLVSEFKHDRHINAFNHPANLKGMDRQLVNAMKAALKHSGSEFETQTPEMIVSEHGTINRPINLLRSYYHVSSYDKYPETKNAFFQARHPLSVFFLPGRKNTSILLNITLRVPQLTTEQGKAVILFNHSKIGEIDLSEKWSDHVIPVPGDDIAEGINELAIAWPIPVNQKTMYEIFSATPSTSGAGFILDAVYSVFGEIIRFKAEANYNNRPLPINSSVNFHHLNT